DEFTLYLEGNSIPEVSQLTDIPISTLRNRFLKAGILRSRKNGIRNAFIKGKIPSTKGIKRHFTKEWCENISKGKRKASRNTAVGIDESKGYPRITTGENKGKFVHRLVMENHIGRPLTKNEHVHHIDGNIKNNSIDNLALVTVSGHARLHRYQDELAGQQRARTNNGRFE
ncbi:HNH endonuclease signature motif containing protein, partial [Avibacterium avium]|uniref:HNH endonuclease signature motif containing protein n=1 Tax=Avibacterium avium TaxID=751 RepID=UPI003BF8E946